MSNILYLVPLFGVVALIYTFIRSAWVTRQPAGDAKMTTIAGYIAEGAMAFLKAEYKVLAYFVVIAGILLGILSMTNERSSPIIVAAFVIGAVFSAVAGFIGMRIATKANVRTAQAARTSLAKALNVSFSGGSVMGMGVAGLAVLGLGTLFIIFKYCFLIPSAPPTPTASKWSGPWKCSRASRWAPKALPCLPGWAAASTPRPPTWAPTWWVR
jgi:K(+)-stimulated pyrophosphate-energized sodium pump